MAAPSEPPAGDAFGAAVRSMAMQAEKVAASQAHMRNVLDTIGPAVEAARTLSATVSAASAGWNVAAIELMGTRQSRRRDATVNGRVRLLMGFAVKTYGQSLGELRMRDFADVATGNGDADSFAARTGLPRHICAALLTMSKVIRTLARCAALLVRRLLLLATTAHDAETYGPALGKPVTTDAGPPPIGPRVRARCLPPNGPNPAGLGTARAS